MSAFVELSSNSWFIGILVGVVPAAVGIFVTLKITRKVGRIVLTAWSNNLVTGLKTQASGLAVTFDGQEIPSATVARIVMWNDGNVVVRRESIDPKDPIAVELAPGVRLLDLTQLSASDPRSGVTTSLGKGPKGGDSFRIDFDYLKPGKGAAVQLVYSGTGVKDLLLRGTLIDHPSPVWVATRRRWLPDVFAIVIAGLVISGFVIVLLPFQSPSEQVYKVIAAAGWVVVAIPLYLLRNRLGQLVLRAPSDLRQYSEGTTSKSR